VKQHIVKAVSKPSSEFQATERAGSGNLGSGISGVSA
jgi:hypothetical protein